MVPDRWEFANDNFRRGEQRFLSEIRRRKAAPPQALLPSGKSKAGQHQPHPPSSTSNSGEVHSSSSTSSPPPSSPPPQKLLDLTNENDKLKKDNERLSNELSQSKKRCGELLGVLSNFMDVGKLDINLLMREKGLMDAAIWREETTKKEKTVEEEVGKKEEGLRLFGVLLKGFEGEESKKSKREKRGRCDEGGEVCGAGERPMKMGFGVPWMGMSTPVQQSSSKVYN